MIYFGENNNWTSKPIIVGLDRFTGYSYKPDIDNLGKLIPIDSGLYGIAEFTYDQLLDLINGNEFISATEENDEITNIVYDIQAAEGADPSEDDSVTVYPSYVDVIFNPESEAIKLLQQLYWITACKIDVGDSVLKERYDKTFTHILIYTNYQCSGYIELRNHESIITQKRYRNVNGKWNFNSFRDLIVHNQMINDNGTIRLNEELSNQIMNEIIDYLSPTTLSIEGNATINNTKGTSAVIKSYFDKSYFKDSFFIVRFVVDNTEDYELSVGEVGAMMSLIN